MGTERTNAADASVGVLGKRAGYGGHGGARSKYGAKRAVSFDGRVFPSIAERDRYHELLQLIACGAIKELTLQPRYHFAANGKTLSIGNRPVRYTADFRYLDAKTGEIIVEDVKGFLTRDAQLRIAMMAWLHGIAVRLVKPRGR